MAIRAIRISIFAKNLTGLNKNSAFLVTIFHAIWKATVEKNKLQAK